MPWVSQFSASSSHFGSLRPFSCARSSAKGNRTISPSLYGDRFNLTAFCADCLQVTWINTGTFSLYLIPWAARTLLDHSRKSLRAMSISDSLPTSAARKTIANDDSRSGSLEPDQEGIELIRRSVRSPLLNQVEEHERSEQHRPPLLTEHSIRTFGSQDAVTADSDLEPLTTMETAKLGCVFSLIWFAANYFGEPLYVFQDCTY